MFAVDAEVDVFTVDAEVDVFAVDAEVDVRIQVMLGGNKTIQHAL